MVVEKYMKDLPKNKVIAFDYIVPYLTQTTNDITVIGHSTTKKHEINRISCATRDETRRASVLRTHLALSAKNQPAAPSDAHYKIGRFRYNFADPTLRVLV